MTTDQKRRPLVAAAQVALLAVFCLVLTGPFDVPDPVRVGPAFSWTIVCLGLCVPVLMLEWLDGGWRRTALDWPIGAYVAIVVVTGLTGVDPLHTLGWSLSLAGYVAVFLAAVCAVRRTPGFAPGLLLCLVPGPFLVLVLATGYHAEVGLLTRPKLYPSPAGWFGYPEIATLAVVLFALVVAAVQTARRPAPLISGLILAALTLAELALLYARGGWLAAAVVLAAAATIIATRAQVARIAVAGAVLAVLAGTFVMKNQMLRQLAVGDPTPINGYQLELATPKMRLDLWRRTGRMIADHAATGVGLGNFQQVFESKYNPEINIDGRRGVHAHNLWLQQFAETGVAGGAIYLGVWVLAVALAWRAARRQQSFATAATFLVLTALAASNVTTNMFYMQGLASGRLYSLAWMLFGLTAAQTETLRGPSQRRDA